ncbi:caspase family protein [Gemmata sp. G18]|uniref:Caspase family protein n=1 Tax=Gemmata palustris TaxID=2822762 RepID=A0ABS5BU09_9BACT|nr:caspase family protein [Gemmata palustris]MBP3956780.1 caspase family protein [Gemmata palustris]
MPIIKTCCPKCDTRVRVAVDEDGDHEVECPKCGHEFTAGLEDAEPPALKPAEIIKRRDRGDEGGRPGKYRRKDAGASKAPLVAAVVAGALVLVGGLVALVLAFSSPDKQPVAQADPPAKANPVSPKLNPDPPKPNPKPEPVSASKTPAEPPAPVGDVFARAASFKPEGPLPELPPLPPGDRRPMLVLDPGGHTGFVRHVFFTPDGNRVISVAEDKSVRLWDVPSGAAVYTARLPAGPDTEGALFGAALSPNGKHLVVGGFPLNGGRSGIPFYVLAVETGELLGAASGAADVIHALEYSPDGRLLAVGCGNGTLQVYDLAARKWVYEVPAHTKQVKQIRFHPKRPVLAAVGRDSEVTVWALSDRTGPTVRLKLAEQGANTIDWASDGSALAIGCGNGEVLTYDPAGKPLAKVAPALEDGRSPIQIVRMRFLPGDKQFVFGGIARQGWAGVTDVETGRQPVVVKEHTNTVMAVNRSADGARAVTAGGENNEIIVWGTRDGAIVRKFQSASKSLWAVGWGKDGKSLAWGNTNLTGADGLCALEQALRLDEFVPGPAPEPGAYARHVRDDGTYSVRVDNFFQFTVLENGKPLYQHKSRADRIYSVSLLPGRGVLVGASFDLYLLETKTGKLIRQYRGDRGLTTALAPAPDGRHFVSGSSDQVLRVWAVDREDPVLSVFAVSREWIAWTPQGYYACSPYGERLIAWQVSAGVAKLPAVHPAVRFRASLYQPALIKYLIPAGDMRLGLAMVSKFERQQITATGLADVLPPGVTLAAPVAATDKPITVRATAEGSAKNPIVAMRLLVDGRPYDGAAGVKRFDKQPKAEASWEVTLGPGTHTLVALAESPVSKGGSAPAVVTRAGAEPLPNLYVLAVGVSAYPGSMKLNYAASDAILLTDTLRVRSKAVFGTIEMKVLTDKQGTKTNIREGLDWLKAKMTAKDVGIVFFSGHGGRDEGTGKFYLIPVDVGPDMERTCLSGEELKSRLEDMPGRLVAILDACHSGAVTEIRPAQTDNLVRDLMTDDYGVVVLASSLGGEYSLESPATKAGFYTLGLTEGMGGRADFNRDGVVHLNELEHYAAVRVQQLSGGQQNPTLGRPSTIRPLAISKP